MADESQAAGGAVLSPLESYIAEVAEYDRVFKTWNNRAERVVKRYIDDDKAKDGQAASTPKYNVLWSNVQTLSAATFAKLPKPDVTRRFSDNDPVGRVAALILERCLCYEVEEYPDYGATMRQVVLDRFLGGRGTAWARYEPHMRAGDQLPVDGVQTTEDVDEPQEALDYECAPVDYVHWRDFGHSIARTWEEVTCVWRRVYMDEGALKERFSQWMADNPGKRIPLEGQKNQDGQTSDNARQVASIYERWDKTAKRVTWWHKTAGVLDERDDPLGLTDFFPCPKPLYATLTNDSLVPTPDFTLYQDQAKALDVIAARQQNLIQALRLCGVYDASATELARLFTETEDNALVPVSNWQNFAEKNGLKGSLDLIDLAPIAQALTYTYEAAEQVQHQIYEITGISDIIRGQTQASETATAQQLKGQYASLRLKAYQDDVARFATDLLRLKAQVICGKFAPQTILAISASDQLQQEDQQMIGPAMQLLLGPRAMQPEADSPNPVRSFRIEVAADTLVYIDEQQEKADRMEFMQAFFQGLPQVTAAAQQMPQITRVAAETFKFAMGSFRQAAQMEGVIDAAFQQIEQAAMQPKPDPAAMQAQVDQQKAQQATMLAQQKAQMDMQLEQQRQQMDAANAERQAQIDVALERMRMDMEEQRERERMAMDARMAELKAQLDAALELKKAEINAETMMRTAEIGSQNETV